MKRLFRSFRFGLAGLTEVIGSEPNMRLHLVATVAVIGIGAWLQLSSVEWAIVTLSIGSVLALECINTAVERLANRVTTDLDPLIKQAKDVSAGAVLLMSIASAIAGCVIFVPKIFSLIRDA